MWGKKVCVLCVRLSGVSSVRKRYFLEILWDSMLFIVKQFGAVDDVSIPSLPYVLAYSFFLTVKELMCFCLC